MVMLSLRQKKRRWALLCFLAVVFAVMTACLVKTSFRSSCEQSNPQMKRAPDGNTLSELGWTEAITKFQKELVSIAVDMKKREKNSHGITVDIAPFNTWAENAINTFGVRAVFTHVFHDIEWYFPETWYRPKSSKKEKRCNWHGIGCSAWDIWFIWHYVGAVCADLLLREDSLLLDSSTGERVYTAVGFMDEIHRLKAQQRYVTRMSFHAEHGFIWHYLAATQPDLNTYPLDLAHDFCSKYDKKVYVASVNKYIGVECYHGFGHGIFEVLAMQQMQQMGAMKNYNASRALRAKGGFQMENETFCKAYRICEGAPKDVKTGWTTAWKHCRGGIQHAYWLFSDTLPKERSKVDSYFEKLERQCNIESSFDA